MQLQLPDGSTLAVPAEGMTLGRGSPSCWADASISRQQLRLSPLPDVPGVLKLHNLGMNAVLVEARADTGAEWELREVLDQGMDTLVDACSRFYLLSRLDATLITLAPAPAPLASPSPSPSPAPSPTRLQQPRDGAREVAGGGGAADLQRPLKRPRHAAPDATGGAGHQQRLEREAPFQLLAVRGLEAETAECGAAGVRLRDVVEPGVTLAVVSNYMVDLAWLLSACPALLSVQQLVLVHGEHGERQAALHTTAAAVGVEGFTAHRPPLPIAYGTHHSKAFLLLYPAGLRVVVHTANLIHPDCNNKAQGLWAQDFPPKGATSPPTSAFEAALTDYLAALALPVAAARAVMAAVRGHDFSGATAALVPSVPGYHTGAALQRYGHMRVRALLAQEEMAAEWREAAVVVQCSSLGSLDDAWLLSEFGPSLAAGRYQPATGAPQGVAQPLAGPPQRLPAGQVQIVWPTAEEVRGSVEGWAAGFSIPGTQKNVSKPFLQRHWHRYGGHPVGRARAMPHIKTYARYIEQRVAWVLLTSHNLSKAAWGSLQKAQRQLMVRSYELGVLLLPSLAAAAAAHPSHGFSCTAPSPQAPAPTLPVAGSSGGAAAGAPAGAERPAAASSSQGGSSGRPPLPAAAAATEFVSWEHGRRSATLAPGQASTSSAPGGGSGSPQAGALAVPLPFPLPPVRYTGADQPWMCDVEFPGLDSRGRPCGAPWQFYGLLEDD